MSNIEPLLTVIPARGGSKGIIRKNLQIINGKTLVERSVIAALKIPNNRVVVSTDDSEISEHLKKYKIELFKRSEENALDTSSSESVVLEVLNSFNYSSGLVTLLQATSPFIDIEAWEESLRYLSSNIEVHSMFSATNKNNFSWKFNEFWSPINHDKNRRTLRQNKPAEATETGSFYIVRAEKFLENTTRFCGVTVPAFTKKWADFDIDNVEDLNFCRDLSKILDYPPYLQ